MRLENVQDLRVELGAWTIVKCKSGQGILSYCPTYNITLITTSMVDVHTKGGENQGQREHYSGNYHDEGSYLQFRNDSHQNQCPAYSGCNQDDDGR